MTWSWENVARTTWTTDYALILYGGDSFGAKTRVPFPGKVSQGDSLTLAVIMKVPKDAQPGIYHSSWALVNPDGDPFYVDVLTIRVR